MSLRLFIHTPRFLKRHEKELDRCCARERFDPPEWFEMNAKEEIRTMGFTLLLLSFGAPSMGGFVKSKLHVKADK
jgi:hypothetical protein